MIGKQPVRLSLALLAIFGVAVSSAHVPAATIAHWSFDTPTITTDPNGIVTAGDSQGNHNATTQLGGTGATITSVTGQFGEAARFNNTNANGQAQTNFAWMSFPQLTEIAGASGGDFSVAAWVNVPDQTSWDDNPILVDWGNAPANTRRFTYWFQLDNVDSNAGLRPRAQMRAANTPVDPMNIDILATTLSSAQAATGVPPGATTFDDGAWHHLAWTWTKSTGQMRFYTDGILRHTQTSTQTGSNLNIAVSDSPVGALGAKRDNNRYFVGAMDEVWVIGRALSDAEIALLRTDNTIIPEPASALLCVLGLLSLGTFTRRRS
jgi:hypothetical protein